MYNLNELREKHADFTGFLLNTEPLSGLLTELLDTTTERWKGNKLGDKLAFYWGLMMGAEAALWSSVDKDLREIGARAARERISSSREVAVNE